MAVYNFNSIYFQDYLTCCLVNFLALRVPSFPRLLELKWVLSSRHSHIFSFIRTSSYECLIEHAGPLPPLRIRDSQPAQSHSHFYTFRFLILNT